MTRTCTRETPRGAYGLRLSGVDAAALLVEAEETWPRLRVTADVAESAGVAEQILPDRALLRLRTGGSVAIDRVGGSASYCVPRALSDEELVHPYLAPVACVMAHWLQRESYHAGGLAVDGRVWGVIGDRLAGKSSTLAWLALNGHEIVADDLLVVDVPTRRVFAGPRSIDLRDDAAAFFSAGTEIGLAGTRERWRLRLGAISAQLTLSGWIFLAWGESPGLRPLGAAERITRLSGQRGLRLPPADPTVFLDLASIPCWELRRPRHWEALKPAIDLMLDIVAG